jgi:hypothetical protein
VNTSNLIVIVAVISANIAIWILLCVNVIFVKIVVHWNQQIAIAKKQFANAVMKISSIIVDAFAEIAMNWLKSANVDVIVFDMI